MFLTHPGKAVEGGTTSVARLHHQCNQPTHVTDGMKVTHFLLPPKQDKSGYVSSVPNRFKPKSGVKIVQKEIA
jgi:hypothetical protein